MKTSIVALLATLIFISPARASDDTCRLQERLSERGYFTGEITCTYGDRTYEAVRKFQIDNGLHVDGIAGEDTRRVLFAEREKPEVNTEDRKAPEAAEDVAAACKPAAIEEIGAARPIQSFALGSARTNWARKARFQHGELYADPTNARILEDTCTKSSVGGLITNYRCIFRAFPCRAGS